MIGAFHQRFGPTPQPRVFRAPGRVNLIGEHTDYNLGFVLPVALDLATYIAAAPSPDGKLRIYSEDRQQLREFDASSLGAAEPTHEWTDYPVGVARELVRAGVPVAGANLLIRSTVPDGAGLSSSAALEVSSALALLAGREFDPLELAKLCQRAERNFVGMPCGIMDQYISVFGRAHSAVEIDCRNFGHRLVNLPGGITFIAVNTMVKHALSGSAYRDRVRECAAAVEGIATVFPDVRSLRDVSPEQFAGVASRLPEVVARRARHVVTEDARVNRFVEASTLGDVAGMGKLMLESHRSLQHDYEVSCAELDFLVDAALALDGVYGSRMTGGGFGGCTVTLLRSDAAASFRAGVARAYHQQYGVTPRIYSCEPSEGAGEVKKLETIPSLA
ncbi:MAG: galactokinase [Candidatus Solibacter sp.]|nr:galactokinase [Candidatus Solibacter sp.]